MTKRTMPLSAAAIAVAADLAIKTAIPTEQWAQHHRSLTATISHLVIGGCLILAATLSRRRYLGLSAAVAGAGAIANGIDLAVTGWAHNPFVIVTQIEGDLHQRWAFNLADVWVTAGACATMLTLTWALLRPTGERRLPPHTQHPAD